MENKFDLMELPEGHEMRFRRRLEASDRRRRSFRALLAAAAAVALLVLLRPVGGRDYFRGVADSPDAVYLSYLDQVAASYESLARMPGSETSDWEVAMRSVTEETIPMMEQLPDELSDAEKAALLKAYYGALLDGVERIRKSIEKQ